MNINIPKWCIDEVAEALKRITKKANEVRLALAKNSSDGGFFNSDVDYVIFAPRGKEFNKIRFYNPKTNKKGRANISYFEITYRENEAFLSFGEEFSSDFVLNSKVVKSIYELYEVINEYATSSENRFEEYEEYFGCELKLVLRMIKDGCYFRDFETGKIKRCLNVDYDFKDKEFSCHYGNGMTCYSYEDYGTEIAYTREELEENEITRIKN